MRDAPAVYEVTLDDQLQDAIAYGMPVMWPYRIEWRVVMPDARQGGRAITHWCRVIDCRTDMPVDAGGMKDAVQAKEVAREMNAEYWAKESGNGV